MARVSFILAAAAVVFSVAAAPALAQTRVFVSGSGSDANPCSLSAPCRSFQQAHNTVLAGGEIVALDAAGYGPLDITKAVTVTAIGIEASITSSSANNNAIVINAGSSDTVTIRGLTLISGFTTGNGLVVSSAKSVTIRDCSVSGFPGNGILVNPSANMNVELRGVTSDNNHNNGLDIAPTGSAVLKILVTDTSLNGNTMDGAVIVGQNSSGTIAATLSVAAAANAVGVSVISGAGNAQPIVMVTGSKIVNNSAGGLLGDGNVQVWVDRTQITGNGGLGWQAFGGAVVQSYKNNDVNGNGADGLNSVVQISNE